MRSSSSRFPLTESQTKFSVFDHRYQLPYHPSSSRTKDEILMVATVLFAREGYAAVTMRDIAGEVCIKAASLYNHFESKEALWHAALDHARELLALFYTHMEERLEQATSFEEVLQIFFEEPERMDNAFTCYAFALIQTEQIHDDYACDICLNHLSRFTVDFIRRWLDICVNRGFAQPFDTGFAAILYSQSVLSCINLTVHALMDRETPYHPGELLAGLRRQLLEQYEKKTDS